MAEFRINISNLSEGLHTYMFEVKPVQAGLDERFSGVLKVTAKLDKSSRQILLHTEMKVSGVFECDRCLEQFDRTVEGSYSLVYLQNDRSMLEIRKEEEIQVISADTNYIDLDEDIRQFISLAVPAKLLCKESCNSLCLICGVNKNKAQCNCDVQTTDIRWEALKKISHNRMKN